jgi:fatty-acyl-CoA synthase
VTAARVENLFEMLAGLADRHPDAPALIEGGLTTSFAELADRSDRLAAGLAGLGVGRGDLVAVWLPNTTAWVEVEFAVARLGAIALSVNSKLRSHDVSQLLDQAQPRVLVVWPGFRGIDFLGMLADVAPNAPASLQHVVLLGEVTDRDVPELLRDRVQRYEELLTGERFSGDVVGPDLPVNAFTSSGTTSAPKLVPQTHAALVGHSHAVADTFGYREDDVVVLGMLPFCGVFGCNTLLAGLAAGRPVVVQAAFDGEEAVSLIEQHQVTHTNGADDMLRRILEAADPPSRIASLREAGFASFGGDPHALVAAADALGKRFFQTYGSSEVQALMCYPAQGADVERRSRGGGVPVSDAIRVRVRDLETGEVVRDGGEGEIEVSGPNVTPGYLNQTEATARSRTDDGWFRTGDLGRMVGDRDVVYVARLGDALRLGGFLVGPREIEAYLEQLHGVAAAQVVGVQGEGGDSAVGFVVPTGSAQLDEDQLLASCRRDLARFKVPRRILVVDAFPTTRSANGDKIQRVRLREMAAGALDEQQTEV